MFQESSRPPTEDVRMKDMNCNELVERVTECLEEALDRDDLARLLDHLQLCDSCDAYFNEVLVTLKVLEKLPSSEMPTELESNLLETYRQWAESAVA
jgi:predicted anti-sigma-YlaC factor YlaD